MTGNVKSTAVGMELQSENLDLSLSNNGITNDLYRYYRFYDKANRYSGYIGNRTYASGANQITMLARNYINASSYTENGITLKVDKDGTKSVSVTDPAAFRSALGLDNIGFVTSDTFSNISLNASTYTVLTSLSLSKGKWIVNAGMQLETSFNGIYNVRLKDFVIRDNGGNGGGSNITKLVLLDSTTTVSLDVYIGQTGYKSSGFIEAIKII